MDGVGNGVKIYAGTRITALALTMNRGSLTMDSKVDAQVDLPKGLFALLFGNDQGLIEGNTLDFKGLKAAAAAYSTITAAYGKPFASDMLAQSLQRLSGGFFDFSTGSWGVGLDYVMGHALLMEKTINGSMTVTRRDGMDAVEINGQAELVTAGGGIHGDWRAPSSLGANNFFPGSGVGANAGVAFFGPRTYLGLSINNLGFIRWGDIKKVTYTVKDTAVQLSRLLDIDFFNGDSSSKRGKDSVLEIMPGRNDTLKDAPALYQSLPTCISLASGYRFDFVKKTKRFRALSQYAAVTFQYDQMCAPWPAQSFVPLITVGVEDGALFGLVPIRFGFFAGGSQGFGSGLGLGLNIRYVKIDLGYTAYGTPYFYPKRGCAMSGNIQGAW
jgi:hypothetical protein